jgi:putative protease
MISMKDLALVGEIAALADAGVASLKIEGRLKGPDYVYTTSRIYRAATEAWQAGRKLDLASARELLKDVFARPHTAAPLEGVYGERSRLHRYDPAQDRAPDATLVSGDRARGEVVVRSRVPVTAGQGFAFAVGFFNGGFLVIAADREPSGRDLWRCKVRIPAHGPRLSGELPLFRNADHERKREALAAMAQVPVGDVPAPTVALAITASGGKGAPLSIAARSADGRSAEVLGSVDLAAAANAPLDAALFRAKFGAFGGTGFDLGALDWQVAGGLFVPASELKALRRALVDELAAQTPRAVAEEAEPAVRWAPPEPGTPRRRRTALWVAAGSLAAARAALAAGADAAWLDDATLDLWGATPPLLGTAGFAPGTLWLRHPATAAVSPHLRALGLPVVAGHLGVIRAAHAAGLAVTADVFCNVFSSETMLALQALGAGAAVISLECSGREVARLAARCATISAAAAAPPALALVVHGRLPAMLTRQDHGLAPGATRAVRAVARDGGLPYTLQRRRHGDTVIWEGRRLCAPAHVQPTAGLVDAWVLELADLDAAGIRELVTAYAGLRDGGIDGAAVAEIARRHAPDGIFPGHLEQGSRELDLVVERMEG